MGASVRNSANHEYGINASHQSLTQKELRLVRGAVSFAQGSEMRISKFPVDNLQKDFPVPEALIINNLPHWKFQYDINAKFGGMGDNRRINPRESGDTFQSNFFHSIYNVEGDRLQFMFNQ